MPAKGIAIEQEQRIRYRNSAILVKRPSCQTMRLRVDKIDVGQQRIGFGERDHGCTGRGAVIREGSVLGCRRDDERRAGRDIIFHLVKDILAGCIGNDLRDRTASLREGDGDTLLTALVSKQHMSADTSVRAAPAFRSRGVGGGEAITGIAGGQRIFVVDTGRGIRVGEGVIGGDGQRVGHAVGILLHTAEHILIHCRRTCLPSQPDAVH